MAVPLTWPWVVELAAQFVQVELSVCSLLTSQVVDSLAFHQSLFHQQLCQLVPVPNKLNAESKLMIKLLA